MYKEIGKKIMVVGSPGSGKTTFSNILGDILGIEVIHLDKIYWKAGWIVPEKDEWIEKVKSLMKKDSWIIDGNYNSTMEMRLEKADTVIFLDYNRYICTFRAIKRCLGHIGKTRPDMAEGCNDKIDIVFLKYIWRFPTAQRGNIQKMFSENHNIKKIIFRNTKESNIFIDKIKKINA